MTSLFAGFIQNRRKTLHLTLFSIFSLVFYFQKAYCPSQETFDYKELVNRAQILPNPFSFLYTKEAGKSLEAIEIENDMSSSPSPVWISGNYMYFIQNDKAYIRTRQNVGIQVKKVVSPIHSLGNQIIIFDYVPYIGQFYEIWTVGEDSILNKERINTSAFGDMDGFHLIPIFSGPIQFGYSPVSVERRIRGDVLISTRYNPPGTRIYRLSEPRVELVADTKTPLNLHIPELKNIKEPFIIDRILYLRDIGNGTTIILGKTYDEINHFITYYSGSTMYLLDSVNAISIPLSGSSSIPLYGKYVPIITPNADIGSMNNILWYSEWYPERTRWGDGIFNTYFYLYNNKGESVFGLQITDCAIGDVLVSLQSAVVHDSKIYLSMTNLGLVYDIIEKKIIELYTFGNVQHSNRTIVFTKPFGANTIIYGDLHPRYKYSSR